MRCGDNGGQLVVLLESSAIVRSRAWKEEVRSWEDCPEEVSEDPDPPHTFPFPGYHEVNRV